MVQPACLPKPSMRQQLYEDGAKTILSGWGELDPKGEPMRPIHVTTYHYTSVCLFIVWLSICLSEQMKLHTDEGVT